MGTLLESNFSATNQIMHWSKWVMVFRLNWLFTFWRFEEFLFNLAFAIACVTGFTFLCWTYLFVTLVRNLLLPMLLFFMIMLVSLELFLIQGAMLFGKRLEVNFSKHPNITTGADTHEYSNSNLNRFNRNAAKNYRYCCSPTKMIHISTLPQDVTEEEIISHLEEHGTIVGTKLFEMNGKKQALILFENEEQATEALVCKHATSLGGSTIRISFSQLQTIWLTFLQKQPGLEVGTVCFNPKLELTTSNFFILNIGIYILAIFSLSSLARIEFIFPFN